MLESIRHWFEELGWVANAIGIGGPAFGALAVAYRWRHAWLSASRARKLIEKKIMPRWSDDYPKEIGNIAIVDDNLADFPVGELKGSGYRIKTFKQVKLSDLPTLQEFDLVFLDIKGIVKDDYDEGGFKVLERLRENNPRQKICAVSSQTFVPTATAFFRQADDVQAKPISAHKCQEVIDVLLREKLNPLELAIQMDSAISHLSLWQRRSLLRDMVDRAKHEAADGEVERLLPRIGRVTEANRYLVIDFMRILRRGSR